MQCIEAVVKRGDRYSQSALSVGPYKQYGMLAHRVAWEQSWGLKIPPGMIVRHTCDNPPCVNPMHLQLGTYKDNEADKDARGRRTYPDPKTHCSRGHELTSDNLVASKKYRTCRTCNNLSNKLSVRRARAAKKSIVT